MPLPERVLVDLGRHEKLRFQLDLRGVERSAHDQRLFVDLYQFMLVHFSLAVWKLGS